MKQRKRKLIIDKFNLIDVQKMQRQVWDTKDIVTTLDLAPHNRRIMYLKENSSVEKMLTSPAKPFQSNKEKPWINSKQLTKSKKNFIKEENRDNWCDAWQIRHEVIQRLWEQ